MRITGSSGRNTLREGFSFYTLVRGLAADHLGGLSRCRILDFGCGWGRMLRFFVKDVPTQNLYGSDVGAHLVELAANANPWATITVNAPLPPVNFGDESLDLIYLYSVFSHLAEDAQLAWIAEFGRLLRDGGLLIATTWPREYIEWCEEARHERPSPVHHPGGLRAFPETEHWLAEYDAGRFCYAPTGAGANLSADFYGETCVPRGYATERWSDYFDVVDFMTDRSRFTQNVIVARRRISERAP